MQCVHYPKIIPKRAPKNHISFNQIVTKDNRKPQARLIRALGSAHKWKQACVVRQQNIRRSKKKKKKKKEEKKGQLFASSPSMVVTNHGSRVAAANICCCKTASCFCSCRRIAVTTKFVYIYLKTCPSAEVKKYSCHYKASVYS